MQPTLVIFVKAPVPGQVKTRLCPPLSPAEAAGLYRCFAHDTLSTARAVEREGITCRVAYDPHPEHLDPGWLDASLAWHPQRGADLGTRLSHASATAFSNGADPVVFIGSDAPGLAPARVLRAFKALQSRHIVLGPSTDGGYYLIGVRRHLPSLFREIDWSTRRVLQQTRTRARTLGLTVALLAPDRDLDTWADVAAWYRSAARRRGTALRTRREVRLLRRRYGAGG